MIQVADLCQNCEHFDLCNWECGEKHYLDSDKITIECEDYKQGEQNK